MKKRTTIALSLLAAMAASMPCSATAAGTLTLDEAMRMARELNPRARQAAEEVAAADARITQSRSARYPHLSGRAGYIYKDPVSEVSTYGGGTMKFMPNSNYDTRVAAEMVLFDFGRTGRNVDIAKSGLESAGIRRDITLRELSLSTVRAFYSVLYLQEAVELQEKEINALKKNLEHMQKRYGEGVATRYDLLTTQVRLAAAENRKIDLLSGLDNQAITLRRLCGLPKAAPLDLKGSFELSADDAKALQRAASGVEQRPELQLARENLNAAGYRKSLAAKERLPRIVGSASYGLTNGYLIGSEPDIEEMRANGSVGVELQLPIFTGFRTAGAVREATAMMRSAEQEKLDTEQTVEAEIRQSVNNLKTSLEKTGTTRMQVSQAELAARHARIRYQNGLGTTLDLLDAESALAQAELAHLQARYAYVLDTYEVRRASGELFNRTEPAE